MFSLAIFVRWMGERLCFLGKQVHITTGLLIFAIIGIAFNGSLLSFESNDMNAQYVKEGIIFPESTPSSKPHQVAAAEDFSWPDRKLDINDPGNCPNEIISGFIPALLSTTEPVCEHTSQCEDTCDIEQSANHLSNTALCDKLEETQLNALLNYVFSLKYNLLSFLSLLLLLADGMFGFIRRWPDIGVGVAIIIVVGTGISEFLTCINDHPATSFQYDCATLIYVVAHSLMFLSLILKQAEREWLSCLMAGISYSCGILGILGYIISCLTLEYDCVLVSVLFFLVLFTVSCGYNPDRID